MALMPAFASAQAAVDQPVQSAPADSATETATQPEAGLTDIIVTAEKRVTSLQKTPLAVSAITAETILETQTRSVQDLVGRIPNLQIGQSAGIAQVAIRGVSSSPVVPGAESAIAVNVNNVYISRQSAVFGSFYDLERVEVLRGPQGTLYGRNATAGSINITTARPTDTLSGYVRLTVGSQNTMIAEGAVGGALIPGKLQVRLAGISEHRDGYGRNLVTGSGIDDRRARAVRLTVVATPVENLTATVIGEYFDQNDRSGASHYFGQYGNIGLVGGSTATPTFLLRGGYVSERRRDIAVDYDPIFQLESRSLTGQLDWKLGDLTLRSVSGYRDQKSYTFVDPSSGTPTGAFITFKEPAHQFSQEFNAIYNGSNLDVTAGLFYFKEKDPGFVQLNFRPYQLPGANPVTAPALPFIQFYRVDSVIDTEAKAAFAQATYNITDAFSATAGIRYSDEKKSVVQTRTISLTRVIGDDPRILDVPGAVYPAPVERTIRFDGWTPKAGLQYQITDDTLVYGSYSKGFRAGTFDIQGVGAPSLEPEKVTAYEAGLKSLFAGNRIRLNVAGFYYDYTNLAIIVSDGNFLLLRNAGAAEIYGGEAELSVSPFAAVTINANYSYTRSRFSADYCSNDPLRPLLPVTPRVCNGVQVNNAPVNYRGNTLPYAPKHQFHIDANYTVTVGTGEVRFRGEVDYQSEVFFAPNNLYPQAQGAFAKANAFVTYEDGGLSLSAFVRNITDKVTIASQSLGALYGGILKGGVAAPRTYGVSIGFRY